MQNKSLFPLIAGIAGVVGAILTLPFFLLFVSSGLFGYSAGTFEGIMITLATLSFGLPAILQIIYFFRVHKVYSANPEKANTTLQKLRNSGGLRVLGWICAISCGMWVLVTLGGAFTGYFLGLLGILPMAGSTYFNFHTLLVMPKNAARELEANNAV